jgi:hypothetical protein
MRINDPKASVESEADLISHEQRLRGQKAADRVRMLRLLKRGPAKSLQDCAPVVGYSVIQGTRWWERDRQAGLPELLKQQKPIGMASRMTPEAWEGVLAAAAQRGQSVLGDLAAAFANRFGNGSAWHRARQFGQAS